MTDPTAPDDLQSGHLPARLDDPFELSALEIMAGRYSMLAEIARQLIRESALEPLVLAIVDRLDRMVGFERCSLALLRSGGTEYDLIVHAEPRAGASQVRIEGVPVSQGIAGRAIRRRRSVYVPYQEGPSELGVVDEGMEGGAMRTLLSAPMVASSGVLGALTLGRERPEAYTSTDLRMVRQVADMLALAWERQRARDRRQELDRKLRARTRELEETVARLQTSNLELDGFVYAASHDLRAPLLSIAGLADIASLALDEGDTARVSDALGRISRNVRRLDDVVVDVLQISRARRMERLVEPVDVQALAHEVVESLSAAREASTVDIRVKCESVGICRLERRRVRQVLSNLVSNAIKYRSPTEEQPFVEVEASLSESTLILRVADNGIGIPEPQRERIFHMFYRASRRSEGSGLGLYLVKQHLEAMGASVVLDVTDVTVFTVHIPVHGVEESA